jgi:hypothetical protein
MNRKEFQNWLNPFPEDTEIHVVIHHPETSYDFAYNSLELFVGDVLQYDYDSGNLDLGSS